jgi:extradiol dioxygenase family protein
VKCRNPIVIHYVHDMERAKAFYTSVFEVKPKCESPGWTTLDCGAIELALHILYPTSTEPESTLPLLRPTTAGYLGSLVLPDS